MTRGVWIHTLSTPRAYSHAQLKRVCLITSAIGRGPFMLCEAPARCVRCLDQPETFCVECGLVAEG